MSYRTVQVWYLGEGTYEIVTVNLFIERETTVNIEPWVDDALRLQSGFVDSENVVFGIEISTLNKVVLNK